MPVRTPNDTLDLARETGLAKAQRPMSRLVLASILAGAYIALGGVLSIIVGFGFPGITASNPGLQRLLSGLVFPLGLMLIVILGGDLFTGNNALLVPTALSGRISPWATVRNWVLVWVFNFVGVLAVTWLLVYLPGVTAAEPWAGAVQRIAEAKTSCPGWVVLLKGIGANWCVCLAIWLALSGRRLGEKLLACELPVMAFTALGYEHCIANMFFLPLAMMQGADLSITTMFTANLLPATIGNIIGGALFVGTTQYYLNRK